MAQTIYCQKVIEKNTTHLGFKGLRADVCKYQPEVCNSEKFKILKKIHNIAHGKLLQEIHVLLRSDNYF